MERNIINILSGKYELIRLLGEGNSSKVYLARHLTLNRLCAIKIFPQNVSHIGSVFQEARLLPSFHHPGIPQIYDFESDDTNHYLIEEFIEGESLGNYLLHQQFISLSQFLHIFEELCSIYGYLHSFSDYPLLYQDLKPEHILIQDDHIKLIDFDSIWDTGHSGNNISRGNETFSAPEFLAGSLPTIQSDVYTVGKLVEHLLSFVEESLSNKTLLIIKKATEEGQSLRFETVEDFFVSLSNEILSLQKAHLSLAPNKNFAVCGSFLGCESTKFAIELTAALNRKSLSAIYLEQNQSNAMNHLIPFLPANAEKDGQIHYMDFRGFPRFGPGISLTIPDANYYIHDFGSSYAISQLRDMDRIFLIVSSNLWHWEVIAEGLKELTPFLDKLLLVCFDDAPAITRRLASLLGHRIHVLSSTQNPFHPTMTDAKKVIGLLE